MRAESRLLAAGLLALAACAMPGGREPVPTGRLPIDTRPLLYELELAIDPQSEQFSGIVAIDIELDRERSTVWLHALDLRVSQAWVELPGEGMIPASFEIVDPTGVAALRPRHPIGPGRARLVVEWDADFAPGLRGLYRVEAGGHAYAFTQFEAIAARRAFPSFDEPAFKVPFDVRLIVPEHAVALANTPELRREVLSEGRVRRWFARTPPLPSYLLAWAVGPLDVVEAPPIPPNEVRAEPLALRGVASRGRGDELAFALAATPSILESIERYTGSPYPFEKLDIVAVPDFSAGAMENVGLVTFRDGLLLIDPETAPVGQRRAFAAVMAHELAHMWFGNLVTMPWWNDIWLNESFATWLAARTIGELYPHHRTDLHQLQATQGAMAADSLATARRIREPIRSAHDIRSAFDGITYAKGGAVLEMFESAAGDEAFRAAIRRYLELHAFGTATSDDFLAVIADELGADTEHAMRSFLDQPGLPLIAVEPVCHAAPADTGPARMVWSLEQSRYRPLGSSIDPVAHWGIPVCPEVGASCWLLDAPRGEFSEQACREWIHPNPGAMGYYRWTLPAADLERLLTVGWPELSARERMSLADALHSAYQTGSAPAAEVYAALEPLAGDSERPVATAPLGLLREARDDLARSDAERAAVEAYVRELYAERARGLGFDAAEGEDGEHRVLRASLVGAAVGLGRAEPLRRQAAERGRRYLLTPPGEPDADVAAAELLDLVARIAVEDGGVEEFEAAVAHLFASEDAIVRSRMLSALARAHAPELAARARELVFDPRLRTNERLTILVKQARLPTLRADVFAFVKQRIAELVEVVTLQRARGLLGVVDRFCSESAAADIEAWFGERIEAYPGGPRRLAGVVERVRLCAARVERHGPSAREFFAQRAEQR